MPSVAIRLRVYGFSVSQNVYLLTSAVDKSTFFNSSINLLNASYILTQMTIIHGGKPVNDFFVRFKFTEYVLNLSTQLVRTAYNLFLFGSVRKTIVTPIFHAKEAYICLIKKHLLQERL